MKKFVFTALLLIFSCTDMLKPPPQYNSLHFQGGGWIEVELLEKIPNLTSPDAHPVPGFTFAVGDRINGNSEDQVVSWKGRTDISAVGEAVGIRIRMFDAKLFAYRV